MHTLRSARHPRVQVHRNGVALCCHMAPSCDVACRCRTYRRMVSSTGRSVTPSPKRWPKRAERPQREARIPSWAEAIVPRLQEVGGPAEIAARRQNDASRRRTERRAITPPVHSVFALHHGPRPALAKKGASLSRDAASGRTAGKDAVHHGVETGALHAQSQALSYVFQHGRQTCDR